MKSTVELLTDKQRGALARLYGTDAHDALKALCKLEITGLGKDALDSPDHNMTRWYAGQAAMAAKIPRVIKMLNKEFEDNKAKKKN